MGAFMPTRDELFAYVKATFGTEPDYPWPQEPEYAVLRHADNGKWYGIVMSVPLSKLGLPGRRRNHQCEECPSAGHAAIRRSGDPACVPYEQEALDHDPSGKRLRRKGTPRSAHGELSFNSKT